MKQRVFRAGNSRAVVIPAKFAQSVGVKVGDEIEIQEEQDKGKLTILFKGARQLKLTG